MAALLNDATGFHHDNPVRLHDRRQSVSDDQTRAPHHRAFKGLLHKLFIFENQERSSLRLKAGWVRHV